MRHDTNNADSNAERVSKLHRDYINALLFQDHDVDERRAAWVKAERESKKQEAPHD